MLILEEADFVSLRVETTCIHPSSVSRSMNGFPGKHIVWHPHHHARVCMMGQLSCCQESWQHNNKPRPSYSGPVAVPASATWE